MNTVLALLLFVLAGVLVGGIVSLQRQGAGRGIQLALGVLAALALAGGVLWLWPE
jgi:hypothetical protein